MRGIIGNQIVKLAAQHSLDVEDDLATIFPEREENHYKVALCKTRSN